MDCDLVRLLPFMYARREMKKAMAVMMLLAGSLCAAPRVVAGYWAPPAVVRVGPRFVAPYEHARIVDHRFEHFRR